MRSQSQQDAEPARFITEFEKAKERIFFFDFFFESDSPVRCGKLYTCEKGSSKTHS
jgi:hypothetical protein